LPSPPLARWQAQLVQTQTDLLYLGPMLPGSLSRQYKDPAAATGADGQLSYADHMRSRARYVRPEAVAPLQPLHANFRRFPGLVDRCVDLSLKDRMVVLFPHPDSIAA
jgi:hypothetical protein